MISVSLVDSYARKGLMICDQIISASEQQMKEHPTPKSLNALRDRRKALQTLRRKYNR